MTPPDVMFLNTETTITHENGFVNVILKIFLLFFYLFFNFFWEVSPNIHRETRFFLPNTPRYSVSFSLSYAYLAVFAKFVGPLRLPTDNCRRQSNAKRHAEKTVPVSVAGQEIRTSCRARPYLPESIKLLLPVDNIEQFADSVQIVA